MLEKKIRELHRKYRNRLFSTSNVNLDPIRQFAKWFEEAMEYDFIEPNAMTLSTASLSGKPSSRVVLLKEFGEKGFSFFTNYQSRKGKELEENPYASLLFYWDIPGRQIRIDGKVEKVTREETEEYFKTRPYKSRLGAWASHQSEVIESRNVIVKEFMKYMLKYRTDVPAPDYWGGYRLIPDEFEFWQGRPNRLHDRIRYRKLKSGWKIERLSP